MGCGNIGIPATLSSQKSDALRFWHTKPAVRPARSEGPKSALLSDFLDGAGVGGKRDADPLLPFLI